jgi:hypothetical protein
MNDEQINRGDGVAAAAYERPETPRFIESVSAGLPRAPRAVRARSYCAETAWVWQRARLICAVPESGA